MSLNHILCKLNYFIKVDYSLLHRHISRSTVFELEVNFQLMMKVFGKTGDKAY